MHPPPLWIVEYHKPEPPNPDRKDERNAARSHLRDCFDQELVRLTGRSDARMRYAVPIYASDVVDKLGVKFDDDPGWPSDIPFRDLNRIPGGTAIYRRLQSLWDSHDLRLVAATEEDRCNARRDPRLVIPNPAERAAALGVPRAPPAKLVHRITDFAARFQLPPPETPPTTGVVLHPATMEPHFTFPVVSNGSSDPPDGPRSTRARAQRSDINKSRHRPVTNPDGRELRHPKRGPMTTKGIVEAAGIAADDIERAIERQEIVLTDESLVCCVELGVEASRSPGREMGEDSEEDEIESADGEW